MTVNNSLEELRINLSNANSTQDILLQEYIEGEVIFVEALFYKGNLLHYQSSNALQYGSNEFSYTTKRIFYQNNAIGQLLLELGKKVVLNSFANILYIKDNKTEKYHLIEIDPRPNSWIAYSKFLTKDDFIEALKRIVNGDYKSGFKGSNIKRPRIEIALFYKDIRRISWNKDFKGLLTWIFNIKGY
jgi:predicted ATP-grasp superfamily ATP-dependent carboligase